VEGVFLTIRQNVINQITEHLKYADDNHQSIDPPIDLVPDLSVSEAYQIQLNLIHKKTSTGQRIVGKKIGLTSYAMQQLLGVNEPDYGHLLNNMFCRDNEKVEFNRVLQPKVEGEIAFILKEELKGPNVKKEDVFRATEYVVPALEIVGSRISNWNITLADTIADNASSGLYVLGNQKFFPEQVDLASVKMDLYKNNEWVNCGFGRDVLEHPAEAVAWLANKLFEYGITLKKGEVILSGAISAAVNAEPGDSFKAVFTHLGEVSVSFH
jgi:2-keto-4-pentenoate hydratase